MKAQLFIIILLIAVINIFAQEVEKPHPIDAKLTECLENENNYTTVGMLKCIDQAYKDWDAELNVVYKKLMAKLSSEQKSNLKKAQVKWLAFRDQEFENIDSIYDSQSGTMFGPMRLNDKVEIVKNRTLQLISFLNLMEY